MGSDSISFVHAFREKAGMSFTAQTHKNSNLSPNAARKTGLLRSTRKNGQKPKSPRHCPGWFSGPLGMCRATQGMAEQGRALSEGRSPELRSPRQLRVAQGTGEAGTDLGSPSSLATFFLATQDERTSAPQARNLESQRTPQHHRNRGLSPMLFTLQSLETNRDGR